MVSRGAAKCNFLHWILFASLFVANRLHLDIQGFHWCFFYPSSVNASNPTLFLSRSLVASHRSSVLASVFLQFPLSHWWILVFLLLRFFQTRVALLSLWLLLCRVTLFLGLSCGVIARLVTCLRLHSLRASASRLVLSVLSACAFVSSKRGGKSVLVLASVVVMCAEGLIDESDETNL